MFFDEKFKTMSVIGVFGTAYPIDWLKNVAFKYRPTVSLVTMGSLGS
jgi:hypothetical protein